MTTITLDESLFGVRDFGEMTLLEFAELYNEMINSFFKDKPRFYQDSGDPIELLFLRIFGPIQHGYGIDKKKEILFRVKNGDTSHKYGAKIGGVLIDSKGGYDAILFDIRIWIDGVLINSALGVSTLHSYQTKGGIHYLNEAHKKYIHTLHYAEFKQNMARITEELIATAMHPRRLIRHLELGGEIEDF